MGVVKIKGAKKYILLINSAYSYFSLQ